MRILFNSNAAWTSTGYGIQTRIFTQRLADAGHDMAVLAFWGLEGGAFNLNNIRYYPKGQHPYGLDVMGAHAVHFGADIIISLIDAWVLDQGALPPGMRWCPMFPVDHDPIPRIVAEKVRPAYARLVYSRFAERMCHDAGLDCTYIPHAVETGSYNPRDKADARVQLGWPQDKFIIGMVAANKGFPSRKAFVEQIAAFRDLKRKHPDVMLYLHTVAGEQNMGVNLPEYIESLGLSMGFMGRCDHKAVDVLFCDQYMISLGFMDAYMCNAYSAMDVLTSVSMGEGFGVPILEAQACATPVIVGDWTSMGELCFGGWKVPRAEAIPIWTQQASYQFMPKIGAIAHLFDTAYRKSGNVELRKNALAGAQAYDADVIVRDYWLPALDQIAADIAAWSVPVERPAEVAG